MVHMKRKHYSKRAKEILDLFIVGMHIRIFHLHFLFYNTLMREPSSLRFFDHDLCGR